MGRSAGRREHRPVSSSRAVVGMVVMATILAGALGGPVQGAKGEKGGRGGKDGDGREAAADAAVVVIPGSRYKMAKAKVAADVARFADAAGDQRFGDGSPASTAPAWSDISAVYVAPARVPRKLLTKLDEDFPRGAVGAYYGGDAALSRGDRVVFVAVELAEARPGRSVVQQVEVGLDGDGASPVRVGSADDTRAGVERFSLSGLFANGSESSGTTDLTGRRPGEPIELYNAESGVVGIYDAKRDAYQLVMPLPADARSMAVTLRTATEAGEVIDRLDLPGGGHLVSLADPAAGYVGRAGPAALGCRALETYSASSGLMALDDPAATLIRYTAGLDPGSMGSADGEDALAALEGYDDTLPVVATRLDADGEPGSDEPLELEADLSVAPSLGSFSVTLEVPAGAWTFEAAAGQDLVTPAGEALVDHGSLTGRAGIQTGDGLDGFVVGDRRCGRWDLGSEPCAFVPAADMAALVGRAGDDVEQSSLTRPDGSLWCVGIVPASGEPQYIARFGTAYYPSGRLEADALRSACEVFPLDVGAEGVNIDCGVEGYENLSFRVVPDAVAAQDPDGGLLVSVDLLVDPTRPRGERYDSEAAGTLFSEMAAAVARSAGAAQVRMR
jgi:hypothetical protein